MNTVHFIYSMDCILWTRYNVITKIHYVLIKALKQKQKYVDIEFVKRVSTKIEMTLFNNNLDYDQYSNIDTVEVRMLNLYLSRKLFNNVSVSTIEKYENEKFAYILDIQSSVFVDVKAEDFNFLI